MTNWSMLRYLGCEGLGRDIAEEMKRVVDEKFIEAVAIPERYLNPDKRVRRVCIDDPEYDPFPDAEKVECEVIDD